MKFTARILLVGVFGWLAAAIVGPAAQAAEPAKFGIASFEAGTCTEEHCTKSSSTDKFYRQAAGHPDFGITDIKFNTEELIPGVLVGPVGKVKTIRVDIPPGLSVNPLAVPRCTEEELEADACSPLSKLGVDEITTIRESPSIKGLLENVKIPAPVYDIEPGPKHPGVPSLFGFNVAPGAAPPTYLVGGVSWHPEPLSEAEFAPLGFPTGDYHEFFTIYGIPESFPFIETRLITNGKAFEPINGTGPFLTLPSTCTENPNPLSSALVESWKKERDEETFEDPVGANGCNEVPFKPEVKVEPATSQSDRPDAATVKVEVPQNLNPAEVNSSTLKDAEVMLPEGMTLNPAAANGLEACTDAQFGKGTGNPVACPAGSQIGTVTIETPDLPAGSLTGNVYAGAPLDNEPTSGKEYRIFIDAESPARGVSIRLEGKVIVNASTGRLLTAVLENPPLPFSDFIVALNGPHVPLANPLACGEAVASALLTPYTGGAAASPLASFSVDFDGKGTACPSTLPFALTQASHSEPATGGSTTSFTLGLTRSDGNQYLGKVSTMLPPGLVAKVPNVQQCSEADANANKCPDASKIGVVSAAVGAGPNPLVLPGTVYFTGPYAGAPFGLLVSVPADKVGPFNFGTIVTRATVNIDPNSARVIVGATLPTIVGGAPIRLKGLTVTVNRPNFTLNPTNCGVLATESLLTSTFNSTQLVSSPFQASGCSALGFKPTFAASTNAKASRRNGASFEVSVGYPAGAQANIKSVFVQLPKQLPSRLSTLNKACPEATFKANPATCPAGSAVGVASATTPVLPGTLSGPAYFVSHGGASFPDLDVDLSGDGVKVILVGATNITTGITTSTFASIPDVPVSSFHLKLPAGPFSALAARGNLCAAPLIMPTTITAQNGAVVKQNTRISVAGCKSTRGIARVQILSHRVRRHKVILTLRVPSAGRLTVSGRDLRTLHRRVRKAGRLTLSVPLSRAGLRALVRAHRHHHHLKLRVRVRFAPSKGHASATSVRVTFR